jgi:tetratricopeptide (TPR) repeat protein
LAAGVRHHNAGRLDKAERLYREILSVEASHADSLHLLGVVYRRRGQLELAVEMINKAIAVNNGVAAYHSNLGLVLQDQGKLADALASYERAIGIKPDDVAALNTRGVAFYNRGVTLGELKRFDEALASYDQAIALKPDFVEAHNNRGNALKQLKRFEEALASYDQAIALKPDFAEAHNNRGNALKQLKRFEEALASYDQAIALEPDDAAAFNNRGVTLGELKRFDEALASYDKALALRPDDVEAHYNEAFCRLLLGDFDRGAPAWRWESEPAKQANIEKRNFAQPLWVGSNDIAEKTILLHAEQGFGDTIQFCRYVPLVAEHGARVILEVQKPLHELMSTLAGAAQIISRGDPLPDFDIQCPLFSLPLALGTRLDCIPSTTPYLHAPTHALQHWNTRLGPRHRPRIGICWAGNSNVPHDLSRSIGLSPMLPLLANTDVQFFSLQKDLRAGDAEILDNNRNITHLGQEIETFSDTAAIICSMDLVISSDTSVAHLAGSLGKPIWILLQFVPDWRWLLDRDDNPWYPTARLFRQEETRTWDGVIRRVHAALQDFCGASV